jgi:hypothetical protein
MKVKRLKYKYLEVWNFEKIGDLENKKVGNLDIWNHTNTKA